MNAITRPGPTHGAATVALSHGTLEVKELAPTRHFYDEFLGLETILRGDMAIWIRCGGGWMVACVKTGDTMLELPPAVRWCLDMGTAEEVTEAHAAAHRLKEAYGMRQVRPIVPDGDQVSFLIEDLDGNWWEICHRPGRLFDSVFGSPGFGSAP